MTHIANPVDKEALLEQADNLDQQRKELKQQGQYGKAVPLAREVLRLREQALGPEHPNVAVSLNNLAVLLNEMGDYAGARPLVERALRIDEKVLGPEHPNMAASLNNLAELLVSTGDYAGARPLFERALRIKEKVYGPEHPAVALSLNNLAGLLKTTGDYAGAKPLFERALRIDEKVLGPEHPAVASDLNNLALVLQNTGNYAGARPLFERALRIDEKVLGPEHPAVALSLNNLALLFWNSGEVRQAGTLLARAVIIMEQHTKRGLVGLAERQKLEFLRTADFYVDHYLSVPSDVVAPAEAYRAALTRKNLFFRVLAEERGTLAQGNEVVRPLLARRQELIETLTGLVHKTGGDVVARRERVAALEREIEQLEADLSRASTAFRAEQKEAKAGASEVCAAVPREAVLLDYVRYGRYVPADRNTREQERWEDSYTVFLLRGGRCDRIQRMDLGSAASIDDAAKAFREAVTKEVSDAALRPKAKILSDLILPQEVRQAMAGAKTVLIAPDGALAVVPFSLLPGEQANTFLVETAVVATIPSGRDLLRFAAATQDMATPGMLLVGNPDYGTQVIAVADASRGGTRAGCGLETAATFASLPGTALEVQAIGREATTQLSSVAIRRAEGREATEQWLTQTLAGQRYVHLATHGYFAGERCQAPASVGIETRGVQVTGALFEEKQRSPVGTNPLLLSGIALAGANRRAQATSGMDDGILTALEVTGLNLQGTELVTLSACETGLGVQNTGQELLGLRWAFGMAGARGLLTSLWEVPDEPTVKLMTKFYGYLWRGPKDGGPLGKAAALRQAQLDLMKENRARFSGDSRPNDWGAWVLSGDWR